MPRTGPSQLGTRSRCRRAGRPPIWRCAARHRDGRSGRAQRARRSDRRRVFPGSVCKSGRGGRRVSLQLWSAAAAVASAPRSLSTVRSLLMLVAALLAPRSETCWSSNEPETSMNPGTCWRRWERDHRGGVGRAQPGSSWSPLRSLARDRGRRRRRSCGEECGDGDSWRRRRGERRVPRPTGPLDSPMWFWTEKTLR